MKKHFLNFSLIVVCAAALTSCKTTLNSMREPNTRIELQKSDFVISEQVSAEAKTTQILSIDWNRLFKKDMGMINSDNAVPGLLSFTTQILSNLPLPTDKTANYALYNLMSTNKGYDVVFYPQYEKVVERPIGLGFLYKKTTVKVTSRLAKFK